MHCNPCCPNFRFINSAEVDSGNLVLKFNIDPSLVDTSRVCFRFSNNVTIPSGSESLPVVISVGGTNYAVYNKYGNVMLGSELILATNRSVYCPRFVYKTYIGLISGTYHFLISNMPRTGVIIYCER